jgi:glutaminyl-tRNA synthetase
VEEKYVSGWDDPRMPTLRGMRRRGYTPEAIRDFINRAGVAKTANMRSGVMVDVSLLESCLREDLNKRAPRRMAVLNPLKVVIENYPEGQVEEFDAVNNPEDASAGTRKVPFSKVIYIEQDDFREEPPAKYFRLAPGREVRLRYAYFIKCERVIKNEQGEVVELRCSYDPTTKGGDAQDGRKVKATIHWVSAAHAAAVQVNSYDRLFNNPDPEESGDFIADLNPTSLQVLRSCPVEPDLLTAKPGDKFQFERLGYFCVDTESTPEQIIFNRTVELRDTWTRIENKK